MKMNKLEKNELSNLEEVDKVILEILEEEEIDYTCCNVEITEDIKDIGLCPICLEHI
tara:strand:+ start:105 stop:275 length:171 start_codon:yes stop_codon:yes gene_type:complete